MERFTSYGQSNCMVYTSSMLSSNPSSWPWRRFWASFKYLSAHLRTYQTPRSALLKSRAFGQLRHKLSNEEISEKKRDYVLYGERVLLNKCWATSKRENNAITNAIWFYCYALLVLALERITEESDGKIQSRYKHPISIVQKVMYAQHNAVVHTYCDSVLKTGIVFVSVKF